MARDLFENSNLASSAPVGRDLFAQTEPEQESWGEALTAAIPRIGQDVASNLYHAAAETIPAFAKKAYPEFKKALNPFTGFNPTPENTQNSLQRTKQSLAGAHEGALNLINTPWHLANYAQNRLHLLPQGTVPEVPDVKNYVNEIWGAPKSNGDEVARGISKFATEVIPGSKLTSAASAPLTKRLPHLTQKGAARTLKQAEELAKVRNIAPIKIDKALIKDAAQFLPKTSPYKNALKAAQKGDYNALFDLQSELGSHAGDLAKSIFSKAERSHGREGMKVRNKLLEQIHTGLQQQGHEDISGLLRKGQNEYRRYKKFKPYRNALALGAFGTLIPGSPVTPIVKKVLSHSIQ